MLNMIKMDLYRMVRTKSMYVVWIVMAAAIFFSTSMSKLDIDTMNKEAEQQQTESIAETVKPETINMGMSVFLPTQPGEKVTVFDQVYANLQAKFVALFLVIFTVLFSSADIGSGYIKNIGGQVRSRRKPDLFPKLPCCLCIRLLPCCFISSFRLLHSRCTSDIWSGGMEASC